MSIQYLASTLQYDTILVDNDTAQDPLVTEQLVRETWLWSTSGADCKSGRTLCELILCRVDSTSDCSSSTRSRQPCAWRVRCKSKTYHRGQSKAEVALSLSLQELYEMHEGSCYVRSCDLHLLFLRLPATADVETIFERWTICHTCLVTDRCNQTCETFAHSREHTRRLSVVGSVKPGDTVVATAVVFFS